MGILQALRRAEEQARKVARDGMQRTIVGLDDAERAIRRRMRIYPNDINRIRARAAALSAHRARSSSDPPPLSGPEIKSPPKSN